MSKVRENLMNRQGYTPYCGGDKCVSMPRTTFNGSQFECCECGWVSSFDEEFMEEYRIKWGKDKIVNRKPKMATALMATIASMGLLDSQHIHSRHRYHKKRDDIPQEIQDEKIRKAQEKRERKAKNKAKDNQ